MQIAGLDIGFAPDRRTNGLATWIDGQLTLAKLDVAGRNAALAQLPHLDALAIDAPLTPEGLPLNGRRQVERIFSRGAFQKRCKPGFSHVPGTGQLLRSHGAAAAAIATACTRSTDDVAFPRIVPGCNIVEAFPNAFLGVAIDSSEYDRMPQLRRGGKFDWLYDRWIESGLFTLAAGRCGLPPAISDAMTLERDHELRAALVCLLTAAFAHAGASTPVGDEQGGYFFLPPRDLWADWATEAIPPDTPPATTEASLAALSRAYVNVEDNVASFGRARRLSQMKEGIARRTFIGTAMQFAVEITIEEHHPMTVDDMTESLDDLFESAAITMPLTRDEYDWLPQRMLELHRLVLDSLER